MNEKWIVRLNDFKEGALNAEVLPCNKSKRIRKAIKNLFLFFGAGILFVFIPVLHFFLVPTAIILGFFFSYKGFKYKYRIESGNFTCPSCKKIRL
ncbi:MAG: hypothetical protein H7235_06160 [Bdellovibrionaceae bacterium]|nr:hypothetical protein [Pseudobdellovibrionaceae bacterium]